MSLQINCTEEGIKTYPIHKHCDYEVMLYLSGNGYLRTSKKKYPFSPGTIIIVPPYVEHGSTSEDGFKNISVCGEFNHLFCFDAPVSFKDNQNQEGKKLAELIYDNRYGKEEYLLSLCTAYIQYLLQNIELENEIGSCIREIIAEISKNAFDYRFNTTETLLKSGYAEDYIRYYFKKITGKTPIGFLTEIRIKHACFLIDIYNQTLSMLQIAELCGFVDYIYFSKRFKSIVGISPSEYRKRKANPNLSV